MAVKLRDLGGSFSLLQRAGVLDTQTRPADALLPDESAGLRDPALLDVVTCPSCQRGEPCAVNQMLLDAKAERQLSVTVRPDGRVVFFLRAPGERPSSTWEIDADAWLRLAARIAKAVAKPDQFGGAVLAVGTEKPVSQAIAHLDVTPEMLERMVAPLVEPEP